MLKQNKGITLVALVITIIVLLILAGVSISLVVGDNGVLTQATNATKKNSEAEASQALQMALSSMQGDFTDVWLENTSKNFYYNQVTNDNLTNALKTEGYTLKDYSAGKGNISKTGGDGTTYSFELEAKGYMGAKVTKFAGKNQK